MVHRKTLGALALTCTLALFAAACGNNNGGGTTPPTTTGGGGPTTTGTPAPTGTSPSTTGTSTPTQGGTYRTAIEDFGFTGAFDPTGEYLGSAWGLYSDMLLRTLMTYNHVEGTDGDALVPDIASANPDVSADGLTYTFHLKTGIKFGPPLNRDVTSHDIEYAFERINTKPLVAQYGFYYDGVIKGMTGNAPKPAPISGIETPDDQTIIFHLEAPTGDLLYRLAMPATAPIPQEVAKCFTKAGDYGRDVISSGPYMVDGEQDLDVSSCDTIKPESGFDPTKEMTIVRNPNYDPSTDSPTDRENNINGVHITIDTNTDDIFQKIETGDLDGSWSSSPPSPVEQKYLTDPSLKGLLHSDPGDRTWYITMNSLTPPFDDVNVRKAVNYVIDKQALQKAWGGPPHGDIATHIMPPTVLDFGGENYDPYQTPNEAGSLDLAKQEMAKSKYDSNHDGVCDSPVCTNVIFLNRTTPPHVDMTPSIVDSLASIGIKLKVRELDTGTCYTTIQTVKALIPISACPGWGKDYADPSTFAVLFDSSGISCEGQIDYSEFGMTADKAKECGDNVAAAYAKVKDEVPHADADIAKCNALSGDDRTNCWIQFDKDLMTKYVPWVPYLWANNFTVVNQSVTKYVFDQFSGTISWCHIAVNNGIDDPTSLE
ncbi:MAG TPA: ABC transporter substrate-binding protein [Actinomycetota bacterium]|nr:ABC transporter substrate-binding protein [Actinomycetota bacterium]